MRYMLNRYLGFGVLKRQLSGIGGILPIAGVIIDVNADRLVDVNGDAVLATEVS